MKLSIGCGAVAALLFAALIAVPAPEALAASRVMIVMAGSPAPTTSCSVAVSRFVKRVQKDTNGEVMISFHPGGELYADKDIPTAITQDALDMALAQFGTWSGIVPSVVALDLVGGVFSGPAHLHAAQDGPLGKILKEDLAAKGVELIGFAEVWPTQALISGKKLLQKPSDLKGLLLRAPNRTMSWFVEAYGGVPTFTSSSELYTALERGTIDGTFTTMQSARASKWYESAPNITWIMTAAGTPVGIVASRKGWNKLSPKQREIIVRDWAIERDQNRKEAEQQQNESWEFFTKNAKLKTYRVSPEEQKRDWDPVASPYQSKKVIEIVGKEKADQLLKAIAAAK